MKRHEKAKHLRLDIKIKVIKVTKKIQASIKAKFQIYYEVVTNQS
jgi:hypothetical protein